MAYPKELGQPCWNPEQVRKAISLTAQTSTQSTDFFLAAHSPIPRIVDFKASGRTLDEEGVFQDVFSPVRREVQAFVKGEPGTGKSHLIRWLRLRAGHAFDHKELDLHNAKLVLVERGNGSLKDALQQIVDQLGGEFKQHVDRVKGAVDRLSDTTARAKLVAELALEVDRRWTERQRTPLPPSLKHLGQSLRASGFGGWLQRDGGVVSQVIRRLTQQSSVEERESFPRFSEAEFNVPVRHLRPDENARQVIEFSDDLKEEEGLAAKAADALNIALQDAIRELTGLKGSDLLDVFRDIRRILHRQKKTLAIFIEDVSVTGLDQDVINAFEPRAADDLCRMFAVLGITNAGWKGLPDNQKQRGTHVFEVGGDVVAQWANSEEEVARFAARYLNTVRMTDQETASVAKDRFSRDIRFSKCDDCKLREDCHSIFGKVELKDKVVIGLFPFSNRAPQALLKNLSDSYYRSQRGLLDRILLPALDQSHNAFASHDFPRPANFSVQARPLTFWAGFESKFCSGPQWTGDRKTRLRFLAQYWVGAQSAEDLAAQIKPFLEPLGFPKFGAATKQPSPPPPTNTPTPAPPKPAAPEDSELLRLQECLDAWAEGKPLRQDARFRDLLGQFLKGSINWPDQRGTPISEAKRLVQGRAFPRIEGQTDRPATQAFFFDFPRNQETRELLQALLLFDRNGQTWNFEHGELHKRSCTRWLRKHRDRVISSLKPQPPTLRESSIHSAVQVLALAALWRDRKPFSDDGPSSLARIFSGSWENLKRPAALSTDVQELIEDVEGRHDALRDFLVQEVGVGQGDADPKDFVDAGPILEALEDFSEKPAVTPPPASVKQGFWAPRFLAVAKLNQYGDLHAHIKTERRHLRDTMDGILKFVRSSGCTQDDERQALKSCLSQLLEVIDLQRGRHGVLPVPNPPFDDLWSRKVIQQRGEAWCGLLAEAIALAQKDADQPLLAFDPKGISELSGTLEVVKEHLALVEEHLEEQESLHEKGGAGNSAALLEELRKLSSLDDSTEDSEGGAR